ncbi:MAG: UbiD family decarboxylase [Dehalococcoidales bacterium]
MAYKDLREFLDLLRDKELLKTVKRQVDPTWEIGAIMREMFDRRGPAILFEKVKDTDYRFVSGVMDTFPRFALGIGCEPGVRDIVGKVLAACEHPLEPVVVSDGPCQENILTGNDVDLDIFPIPRWHRLDGGRYITLGIAVTKDPETGKRNVAVNRQQVYAKNKVGVHAVQQTGVLLNKYRQLGQAMPVAVAIGVSPAILAAACVRAVLGQDEFGIAGALRGEPVELVKCRTIELEVPANAEVVLEGEIPPDDNLWEIEGPFGEATGYYSGDKSRKPTINLKALTFRHDAVMQGTLEGYPPSESTTLRTIGGTVGVWSKVQKLGIPGIKEIYVTDMGCANFMVRVALERQFYAGHARQVMEAIWASLSHNAKWVIVFDNDIDIYDRGQVEWALSTRVQPHRDIIITSGRQPGMDLDPSIPPEDRVYPGVWSSRIGIDATSDFKGYDFPPVIKPSDQEQKKLKTNWPDYGID